MKTKEVMYERKFSLGNYEMETIGICVEVEEGEKFTEVLARCRKAVLSQATTVSRPQSSAARDLNAVLDGKANG